jgi:hypothetical protein
MDLSQYVVYSIQCTVCTEKNHLQIDIVQGINYMTEKVNDVTDGEI